MTRIFLIIPLMLMVSSASAQNGTPDPGCARDVVRHCRSVMNNGDMVVLACLKQNRARLSKICAKVLTDHGQ
jgi:hypothetical protein